MMSNVNQDLENTETKDYLSSKIFNLNVIKNVVNFYSSDMGNEDLKYYRRQECGFQCLTDLGTYG